MSEKSHIAILISSGSLAVSLLSLLFAIRQSRFNNKSEKLKVLDKVYHDACDLLVFHYRNTIEKPFESDDLEFQQAVREFSNSDWLERVYGASFVIPARITEENEKKDFCRKVREAYSSHEKTKQSRIFDEHINYQSPVFHLKHVEYESKFNRILSHVTENISLVSPVIQKICQDMILMNPENVKRAYLTLKRINEDTCENIHEDIKDPYLELLLAIRYEHRRLNSSARNNWSEVWFRVSRKLRSYYTSKLRR